VIGLRRSNTLFSLAIMSPALVLLGLVLAVPLVRSLVMSFQLYDLTERLRLTEWVGLRHYQTLLASEIYIDSWKTTLVYSAGSVGGAFLLGFAIALALSQPLRHRNWFRGALLVPWVLPPVSGALLWWWIYNSEHGILNLSLLQVGLIDRPIPWISGEGLALLSTIVAAIWRYFPFHMVMLLAGLQTVSPELLDAASVDGAGVVQRFRHVTLPHMRNLIVTVLLLTFIWSFQEFTMIWGITLGGPGFSTRTLNLFVYDAAFKFFRMGQAAAAGAIWLVALSIVALVTVRFGLARDRST
jgi:ABC-type sugar transport system permease subunit